MEEVKQKTEQETKLYTVFNHPESLKAPHTLSKARTGEVVQPSYLVTPNSPRLSLDGSKGIVTGIYGEAPECLHLSQSEAEVLMASKEWSDANEAA